MKTLNFFRKPYLAYVMGFMLLFVSCKQYETNNEQAQLNEVKFDFKTYNRFKKRLGNNFRFDNFQDFKSKIEYIINSYKSNDEISEEQWQQIEDYLTQLGFFDANIDINTIQHNYFNFLLSNNIISNNTYQFINNAIPDFRNINENLYIEINNYKNNAVLSQTEITILDNLSFWAQQVTNKNILCNVGCNVWGGLWGLGASFVGGPWAGFAVGVYAGTTCGYVCSEYA